MQAGIAYGALVLGLLTGLGLTLAGWLIGRRLQADARRDAQRLTRETRADAENQVREVLGAAQEKALAQGDELARREHELEEREARAEQRQTQLEREGSELGQQRRRVKQREEELERQHRAAATARATAEAEREAARQRLEAIAGMTTAEARARLVAEIEEEARAEGARLGRKLEEEARERAERDAASLLLHAAQRVNLREVAESTVTYIELPSDEMKGRIIGKEGRNIRALEMATGIDLVVDDTPRTILVSSFDPLRREVARVAIERLVEDGRIHPARIEEVVQKAREELDTRIEERGNEAAFELGVSDLHPRLARLVGRMAFHNTSGQNLLQHCRETALIGGYIAQQLGARADVARRAGLLHELAAVDDSATGPALLASAELCARFEEQDAVVQAIRAQQQESGPQTFESLALATANRLSENRPGARKENLAVFIERLRRLEGIATSFAGVAQAYAVKAGKEIRILVDASQTTDHNAPTLARQIARAIERELSYPGQIKVVVVRETRAVRYAV